MQLKNIPDWIVLYHASVPGPPFTFDSIRGVTCAPDKLIWKKLERLTDRGLLSYGIHAKGAWLTDEGWNELEKHLESINIDLPVYRNKVPQR